MKHWTLKAGCVVSLVTTLSLGAGVPGRAAQVAAEAPPSKSISLQREVQHAIDKGLKWLATQQAPQGYWTQAEHPALTALALTAFVGDPDGSYAAGKSPVVDKGYEFLLSAVKPDGGIYGGNKDDMNTLANYNTSICMMALQAAGNPAYDKVLLRARNFLVGMQQAPGKQGDPKSPYDGGIGYGDDYKHSDMSNMMHALEALYYTKYLTKGDKAKGEEIKKLNLPAAIKFIERCQNLPGYNDQTWASDDPENKGGFIYAPGDGEHAGETKLPNGKVALRSYASISYAGLLSYIYADMDKNDPRIKAVYEWLGKNYSVTENPGMGLQGLYYYYHTMAKALATYGVKEIETKDGKKIDWRKDLALTLLNQQSKDGYWLNANSRWWENDPSLVTSYTVIALEIVHKGL